MKRLESFYKNKYVVCTFALLSFILLSPKWLIPLAAWAGPACLLYFIRRSTIKQGLLIGWLTLFLSTTIALYEVVPVPIYILPFFGLISGIISLLPYIADRMLYQKTGPIISTLIFPSAKVVQEWLESFGGGGTWSSVAYTQYGQEELMQIASVAGLWGVSFIVYWFASVINTLTNNPPAKRSLLLYICSVSMVIIYGHFRILSAGSGNKSVKTASIAVDHIEVLEQLYKDQTGETIVLPATVSQSSADFQKASKALIPFIENPHDTIFHHSWQKLEEVQNRLFDKTLLAANAGAKIICWSEANALTIKEKEIELIARGRKLAIEHNVYLLMSLGVILPGPMAADRKLIENKAILISPKGSIENVFFKNKPVLGEPAVPGNGQVPVVATPYGRLAISICYDADFPSLIRQAGKKKADVLLLPSGDWHAIDPYHALMAAVRGIENGFTVIRPARGGTSLVSDQYGNTVASTSFYPAGESLVIADIEVNSVVTLYTQIGDWLSWVSLIFLLAIAIQRVIKI